MKKLVGLLIMVLLLGLVACSGQVYDGECQMSDDAFIIDYTILDEEMSHEMSLDQGDQVKVDIDQDSGQLDIFIERGDACIYQANDPSQEDFLITVGQEGTYNFRVIGRKAQGRVSFVLQDS